ncbi:MAG: hypothetical protein KC912_02550 [Proteobacteria bacterium]|nr:hypothetical protein [Pseudomonadota bacterium]
METDDPRVALGAKDVSTRAAAARDLARIGTADDLERLVRMALTEKSSAIRLYSAAAAADIASRGGEDLIALRPKIEEWLRPADPAANPSLLMLWSPFPERAIIKRLFRMVRDPRNAVRAGAIVALRRMALSARAFDVSLIEALAGESARKLTPDAALELAKLAGELGWAHSDDLLRKLATQSEQVREAVDAALERNRSRQDVATYAGFWTCTGLDVAEKGEPGDAGWLAIIDGSMQGPDGSLGQLTFDAEGRFQLGDEPARLLFAAPPGEFYERRAVIQTAQKSWWRQDGSALVDLLEDRADALAPQAFPAMAPALDAIEGAAGVRARLIALWGGRKLDEAKQVIDDLTAKKKPRNDLWFWKARIYAELDDPRTVRSSVETFLAKAKKNAPYRAQAEQLLASL